MKEEEWLACTGTPGAMLRWLRKRVGGSTASGRKRKLRLFACPGMRRLLLLLEGRLAPRWAQSCRRLVLVAEETAEGSASYAQHEVMTTLLDKLFQSKPGVSTDDTSHLRHALHAFRLRSAWDDAFRVLDGAYWMACGGLEPVEDYLASQCAVEREIFGNPFRTPPRRRFPPHIVGLAAAAYSALPEHGPDMLILADALEEAGEVEAAAHFRLPDHVKGCYVLDWVLGR